MDTLASTRDFLLTLPPDLTPHPPGGSPGSAPVSTSQTQSSQTSRIRHKHHNKHTSLTAQTEPEGKQTKDERTSVSERQQTTREQTRVHEFAQQVSKTTSVRVFEVRAAVTQHDSDATLSRDVTFNAPEVRTAGRLHTTRESRTFSLSKQNGPTRTEG